MPIDRSRLGTLPPRSQPKGKPDVVSLSTRARDLLMGIDGVTGVAAGAGGHVIVYISHPHVKSALPASVEGHPIAISVSGIIRAL